MANHAQSLTEDVERRTQDAWPISPLSASSMKDVTDKLTVDGVKLFADAFDKLLEAVEKNTRRPAESAGQCAELANFLRNWTRP